MSQGPAQVVERYVAGEVMVDEALELHVQEALVDVPPHTWSVSEGLGYWPGEEMLERRFAVGGGVPRERSARPGNSGIFFWQGLE